MSTILPSASDTLLSQDHARLHRVVACDSSAPDSSVVVNATGFPVVAAMTASQLVATDGSKGLQSLDTATYPSLTELSYVKGASSALQTQISGKRADSMATNKLLGRGTAGTGAIEEITLGTNLSLSGTTLNATGGGGASATRGTFSKTDLTYTFTCTGVSVSPTAGATYTNNTFTYTVVSYNAGTLVCTGTGYPTTSGTLTKSTGTGDATITFTAFSAKYTITHNLGLSAPYTVCGLTIYNSANSKIGDVDSEDGLANSVTLDFTSFTTMTGTYGYAYIAG